MKVATCTACMKDIMNGEDWRWRPIVHEPVHEKCEPRVPRKVDDSSPNIELNYYEHLQLWCQVPRSQSFNYPSDRASCRLENLAVYGSWGYPKEVVGSLFRVQLGFDELRAWLSGEEKPRIIKTSELQSAESQSDGSTKLAVRWKKDLVIPSSATESLKLVDALNALLNERKAVELRDKEAAEALRRRLQTRTR